MAVNVVKVLSKDLDESSFAEVVPIIGSHRSKNDRAVARLLPEYVDKVSSSLIMSKSPGLLHLFSFLMNSHLTKCSSHLKEYVVGVDGLHRPATFDPRMDSIVRVQVSRLRRKLRQYYRTEGREDRVRIHIPVGSYVPVVKLTHIDTNVRELCVAPSRRGRGGIAIAAFSNLSVSANYDALAAGLTDDIVALLSQSSVRVVSAPLYPLGHDLYSVPGGPKRSKAARLIHGTVRVENKRIRLVVRMYDGLQNTLSHSWTFDRRLKSFLRLQQELAQLIAHRILSALGPNECRLSCER